MQLMRARVGDRLARATEFPIALLIAPAGFGKSMALRDFLTTTRLDVVRYDVRREDDSLAAFARRFSLVLEPVAPAAPASFPALHERIMADTSAPRLVCDWFAEHLKKTICTIVIDDLHFAAGDPATITFLAELMERTCDRLRWIVASRSDAGLPVASWLAYGKMDLPVVEDDLRFTLEEAHAAAQAAKSDMDESDVESLCELTGGWPVGLALALRTQTQVSVLRAAVTREMIYRYLAEQVFASLSPEQREFLMATSVFSSFDVGLAKPLGGTVEFLAELRRGVAFLSEIVPGQFRYHDLFRDFLENELRRRGEAAYKGALVPGGRLLEERGNLAGALALYSKAQDAPSIVRILENDGFRLFERGQSDALSAALAAVPDNLRLTNPVVLGLSAMLDAARGHFDRACSGFVAAIARSDGELRLGLVHRYAIELVRHDVNCLDLLGTHANDESMPARQRVPLLGTLATALARESRLEEALPAIAKALELLDPTADQDVAARVYQQAAYVYSHSTQHDRARECATSAVELALARNLYDVAVRGYSVLYQIAYDDTDDPILCLTILDKLLDCARKGASTQGKLYGLLASYGIEADRGDQAALAKIDAELNDLPEMLEQSRSEVLLPATALQAAWKREFGSAYDFLARAEEPRSDERQAEYFAELSLYAAAANMPAEAEAAASRSLAALERWGQPSRRALRARLVIAVVDLARGRAASAHRHLVDVENALDATMYRLEALARAVRALYRAAIGLREPAALAGALERLRSEHFGGFARLLEAIPFPLSDAGGYSSLTETEREILALMARGLSSKDMADRTSRSPHTVDTHVRSICKKLNCRSRRAAVALATSSGWINNELFDRSPDN